MKTLEIIMIFLTLISTSCDKTDFGQKDLAGRIKEIKNGDNKIISKYSYKSNGQLKESWHIEDVYFDNEKKEYEYTFDSEGKLIGKKGYEPGNMLMSSWVGAMGKKVDYSYEYDSKGRIVKIKVNFDYEEKNDYDFSQQTTFEYPEESIVVATANIINPLANSVAGYLEYHFNNEGNIEKTIGYYMLSATEKRITNESVFTYDSKKSPYNPEPGPASKNNVLSEVNTVYNYDEQGNRSIAYVTEFSFKYTYNSDGYPVSCTETYPNETTIISHFKYE